MTVKLTFVSSMCSVLCMCTLMLKYVPQELAWSSCVVSSQNLPVLRSLKQRYSILRKYAYMYLWYCCIPLSALPVLQIHGAEMSPIRPAGSTRRLSSTGSAHSGLCRFSGEWHVTCWSCWVSSSLVSFICKCLLLVAAALLLQFMWPCFLWKLFVPVLRSVPRTVCICLSWQSWVDSGRMYSRACCIYNALSLCLFVRTNTGLKWTEQGSSQTQFISITPYHVGMIQEPSRPFLAICSVDSETPRSDFSSFFAYPAAGAMTSLLQSTCRPSHLCFQSTVFEVPLPYCSFIAREPTQLAQREGSVKSFVSTAP